MWNIGPATYQEPSCGDCKASRDRRQVHECFCLLNIWKIGPINEDCWTRHIPGGTLQAHDLSLLELHLGRRSPNKRGTLDMMRTTKRLWRSAVRHMYA
jgi:hypothetical protein